MNKIDEHQVLSFEMQELISSRPHWIVRKGNLFFLLVIVLLLIMAWFVKYPNFVKASVKFATVNPPKLLVANSDGKLMKILVSNEQHVGRGQLLAVLESRANYSQVLLLRSWLFQVEASIASDDSDWLSRNPLPVMTGLGNLQGTYQHFLSALQAVPGIAGNQHNRKKWNELRQGLKPFLSNEYKPVQLQKVEIRDNNFKMWEVLSERRRKEGELSLAFLLLQSKVCAWVCEYLVIAPESGKIVFASVLKENERVSAEQSLFFLQSSPMIIYGLMKVAREGLGRIQSSQQVLIQVDGYPSSEFGYLTGAIGSISRNPSGGDSLLIQIKLPSGLETSYHKCIYFRNNLSASASIKIDDSRLLEKFLGTLKKVVVK